MADSNTARTADSQEQQAHSAAAYLDRLRPGGPWLLVAINPITGGIVAETVSNRQEIGNFVETHDGKSNLYYGVNPTRRNMSKKPAKTDVAAIEYIFGDLDPKSTESANDAKARYIAALKTYPNATTFLIDSGNGLQSLWRLQEPIKLPEPVWTTDKDGKRVLEYSKETAAVINDVEARAEAVMKSLGSVAGTQNIDRVLRLPGTTNLPTKKKLKDGRVACPTDLLAFNDVSYQLDSFPAPAASATAADNDDTTTAGQPPPDDDITAFDIEGLHPALLALIRDGVPEGQRSDQFYRVIGWLVEDGWTTADSIYKLLLMFPDGIASKYIKSKRLKKQVESTLAKIKNKKAAEATDAAEVVAAINKSYALVIVGDKTVVMRNRDDAISFLQVTAFTQWLANRHIPHTNKKGETERIPVARYWLAHTQRRQYEGITFSPGRDAPERHYNLWRGFAVEPKQGDCSKFLAHLRDNVCSKNDAHYNWVVGWFAQMVQQPDEKMGTSLVLRGKQGVGKSKVGEVIGSLLGPHYAAVSDPRYITGRFNSHLLCCLLLHADEAFWAGDHSAEGKLKDLVTGDHQWIEFKGKEPISIRSFVRLYVCGNPDWLVPAGFDERRFAIFDVGEGKKQDKPYFAAIDDEMDNGGREALLYHLLHFDLSTVDLRTIPKTDALFEQQVLSLTPEQSWWLDMLMRGELPRGALETNACPAARLFDRYVLRATKQGTRRRAIETQLGMFLRKHVKGLTRRRVTHQRWNGATNVETRGWVYFFPRLDACRKTFAAKLGSEIDWHDDDSNVTGSDWEIEPPPDFGDDGSF
jgi:hypothetical protein